MLTVSHRTLRILAAIAWISGGSILLLKGSGLLTLALDHRPALPWVAAAVGVLIGLLKVKFMFNRFCRRNLERIALLQQPRPWQFFRPGFMLFLAAMVLLGATLSRLALENYPLLVAVVALDFSLATALLGSGLVFREKTGSQPNG